MASGNGIGKTRNLMPDNHTIDELLGDALKEWHLARPKFGYCGRFTIAMDRLAASIRSPHVSKPEPATPVPTCANCNDWIAERFFCVACKRKGPVRPVGF